VPVLASVFDVQRPAGGFYLWLPVDGDDEAFTAELFRTQNVTVVPGSYLARDGGSGNPGAGRVRVSLVAGVDECLSAAQRIRDYARARH
jgi:N-succinyldiaminopimelate aminotransferase